MRKLCIFNQKGGVGKTTTAVNLASGLSRHDKRVLLVDMDPQGSVAQSLTSSRQYDVCDFLHARCAPGDCITSLGKNLDLMHSTQRLADFADTFGGQEGNTTVVSRAFQQITGYDYVIFDCAPTAGLINENVLRFSQECLIPVNATHLSRGALTSTLRIIEQVNEKHGHDLAVSCILPTHYDVRIKSQRRLLRQLEAEHADIICPPIRTNAKLAEAPSAGQSIFSYAKSSRGAKDYGQLVERVLQQQASTTQGSEPISSRIQRLMADVRAED